MEAFLVSTGIVALAEMGDKTQLLSLVLAARFRKPWPIVLGILVATLANHGLAGAVGSWVTTVMGPDVLRWVLGASFIAMAVWMLIPDKFDEDDVKDAPRMGVFLTTVVAHASDFDRSDDAPGPVCFKCRKRDQRIVETGITESDVVVWHCPACGTEGRISNWQGTFWDLSHGTPSD